MTTDPGTLSWSALVAARTGHLLRYDGGILSMWGTPVTDISEGFCNECERDNPHHYRACSQHRVTVAS